jgi:hypothetical protein
MKPLFLGDEYGLVVKLDGQVKLLHFDKALRANFSFLRITDSGVRCS